jgi:hypothetical protein
VYSLLGNVIVTIKFTTVGTTNTKTAAIMLGTALFLIVAIASLSLLSAAPINLNIRENNNTIGTKIKIIVIIILTIANISNISGFEHILNIIISQKYYITSI